MNLILLVSQLSLRYAVFDSNKNEILIGEYELEINTDGIAFRQVVFHIVNKLKSDYDLNYITIAFPGTIDENLGVVLDSSVLPNMIGYNFKEEFKNLVKIDVLIDSIVNCAALTQILYNPEVSGLQTVVFWIDELTSSALIINNQLFKGAHMASGAINYSLDSLHNNGYLSFDDKTNTKALMRVYRQLTHQEIAAESIIQASMQADPYAGKALNDLVFDVAKAVINYSLFFDPDLVLLGGLIGGNRYFVHLLQAKIAELIGLRRIPWNARVERCKYNTKAALYGALSLIDIKEGN